MNKFLVMLVLCTFSINVFAQHTEESHEETHEAHGKNHLAFYTGFTHIPSAFYEDKTEMKSGSQWVPTLGADYFRTMCNKFSLGLMLDAELNDFYAEEHAEEALEETSSNSTLSHFKNNALVIALVGKYKLWNEFSLMLGTGAEMEFESEGVKTFGLGRIGIEYEVEINKGWALAPSFIADLKKENSTVALGLAIEKSF